jgi:hypothetical protein
MKLSKTLSLLAALAIAPALVLAAPATKAKKPAAKAAAAPVALKSSAASVVKVLGDSTLHKWDAKATELTITADI